MGQGERRETGLLGGYWLDTRWILGGLVCRAQCVATFSSVMATEYCMLQLHGVNTEDHKGRTKANGRNG